MSCVVYHIRKEMEGKPKLVDECFDGVKTITHEEAQAKAILEKYQEDCKKHGIPAEGFRMGTKKEYVRHLNEYLAKFNAFNWKA